MIYYNFQIPVARFMVGNIWKNDWIECQVLNNTDIPYTHSQTRKELGSFSNLVLSNAIPQSND